MPNEELYMNEQSQSITAADSNNAMMQKLVSAAPDLVPDETDEDDIAPTSKLEATQKNPSNTKTETAVVHEEVKKDLLDKTEYGSLYMNATGGLDKKKIAFMAFCVLGVTVAIGAYALNASQKSTESDVGSSDSTLTSSDKPEPVLANTSETGAYTFDPAAVDAATTTTAGEESAAPIQVVENTQPSYTPPAPTYESQAPAAPEYAARPPAQPETNEGDNVVQKRLDSGPVLVEGQLGEIGTGNAGGMVAEGKESDLARTLKATGIARGNVKKLGNPDYTMVRGTFIRCTLDTKIVSDVSGFSSCTVNEPIYSYNGKKLLIKPGSKVSGEYQTPDTNGGQERMGVLWNRILTPEGLDVNLDSPGTDGLGGTGLVGDVNNHWGKRLGAAILVSMIDGGMNVLAGAVQKSNTASVGIASAQQASKSMSEMVLEKTINKAPTITINQGIADFIDNPEITEICINRPGHIYVETRKGWQRVEVPELTFERAKQFCMVVINETNTGQSISDRKPMVSLTFPTGQRAQLVVPPATEANKTSITIRLPAKFTKTLEQYDADGFFDKIKSDVGGNEHNQVLKHLLETKQLAEFFKKAVQFKKNIVVAGATGSGKTTFMKSLVNHIPLDERLVTIEDARELFIPHENVVHLLYSKGGQSIAQISAKDCLEACLRMKPDRILLAELRGDEAFYFIRNCASGHPGSITSCHAGNVAQVWDQLALMVKASPEGGGLEFETIKILLKKTIEIVVHIQAHAGERVITGIDFQAD
ncbi:unnamed protein product [Darwinula stevensoni]|uniref:Bacterial type II secretion system protein E domain-containing protein n=1 Tax=Darwinula stevensoni TaxID=69355 RepID=A0A7R9AGF0_9CRUS|nr:unnamed protein product [Darwinula stevensoni]CAG0903969.1 unnamed protein product [Darwinula stevensoni]